MGLRGPPPKSAHILALRGSTLAASRKGEPKPDPRPPKFPKWLNAEGRPIFRELVRQLRGMGIASRSDGNVLSRYVQMLMQWVKLQAFLDENGMTYLLRGRGKKDPATGQRALGPIIGVKTYPQVRISRNLAAELLRIEDRIGLSPSARARLTGSVSPGAAGAGGNDGKAKYFAAG